MADDLNQNTAQMSFMQHLDALRWHLVRSAIAIALFGITLFFYLTRSSSVR